MSYASGHRSLDIELKIQYKIYTYIYWFKFFKKHIVAKHEKMKYQPIGDVIYPHTSPLGVAPYPGQVSISHIIQVGSYVQRHPS